MGVCALMHVLYYALQVLALFNKAIRKLYSQLRAAKEAAVDRLLPRVTQKPATAATANGATAAVDLDLDDELDAAAEAVRQQMRSQFKAEELQEYAVKGALESVLGVVVLRHAYMVDAWLVLGVGLCTF